MSILSCEFSCFIELLIGELQVVAVFCMRGEGKHLRRQAHEADPAGISEIYEALQDASLFCSFH